MRAFVATALAVLLLSGCERLPEAIAGCTPVGQLSPVCGFSRPEDLELLPDGRTLVISQMGSLDGAMPGSLVLFDTRGETITRLPQFTSAPGEHWGSSECDTPPGAVFSPHGIDLSTRADGRIQLLAVNHGGRESVEIFEVATGTAGYQLEWRGCVIAPEDAYLNDVVALPAGGMLMTYMYPRNSLQIGPFSVDLLKAVLGFDTGYVLQRHPELQHDYVFPVVLMSLPDLQRLVGILAHVTDQPLRPRDLGRIWKAAVASELGDEARDRADSYYAAMELLDVPVQSEILKRPFSDFNEDAGLMTEEELDRLYLLLREKWEGLSNIFHGGKKNDDHVFGVFTVPHHVVETMRKRLFPETS